MSSSENKATVKRWMTEVLEQGDLDVIDEVLSPDYVNPAMGGIGRDAMRGLLAQLRAVGPWRMDGIELVAEGDSVVARFVLEVTRDNGEKVAANGLTFYRMAAGKIVEDDPYTRPDLAQLLGLAPPAG
jgi:ketosteroid isomerase-like protein